MVAHVSPVFGVFLTLISLYSVATVQNGYKSVTYNKHRWSSQVRSSRPSTGDIAVSAAGQLTIRWRRRGGVHLCYCIFDLCVFHRGYCRSAWALNSSRLLLLFFGCGQRRRRRRSTTVGGAVFLGRTGNVAATAPRRTEGRKKNQ